MSIYKNTAWSFLGIFASQIINIITNVVLARVLAPDIFGVLGMAIVFSGLIFVIQETGLNSYLIYKKDCDDSVINTTFWLNTIFSIICSVILFLSSSLITDIYSNNNVATVIHYMCIGILIGSIGTTSRAMLTRKNQFGKITKIDIISEALSSIVAIYLVFNNMNLMAISARYLVRPCVQSIILFYYYPIKINFIYFKISEIKAISSYSLGILGSQIFIYFNNNIDFFLVGKLLGSTALGIYTLAFQWGALARYYLSGAIIKALFPDVARKKDNIGELQHTYIDVIGKLAFISFPVCMGMAAISKEFIEILYGQKWKDAVEILQILLFAGAIASVGVIGGPILRGIGKARTEMVINFISFITLFLMIMSTIKYGLLAVVYSELCRAIIIEFLRTVCVSRYIKLKINTILKQIIRPFMIALMMYLIVTIFNYNYFNLNIVLVLFIKIVLGILSYGFMSIIFNKQQTLEIKSIIIKR